MSAYERFHFTDIRGVRYFKDRDPEACPICHRAVKAEEMTYTVSEFDGSYDDPFLEIVFRCPREVCARLFIGRYRGTTRPGLHGKVGEFKLRAVVPRTPRQPDLPQSVADISPSFVEVYGEALAAEAYGLRQIAGAGLRKAVEHLIKDYCIAKNPDAAEDVKQRFLGSCIDTYVSAGNVRDCAKRAAWLGNDETHYERRWEGRDIEDLKVLIRLTVNWIESAELTEQYVTEMPDTNAD